MKFTYVGPHDAVDLPGVGTVERGESVDVPASAASGLTAQPDQWERTPEPDPVAKKAAARNDKEA